MSRIVLLSPFPPVGDGRLGGVRAIRGLAGALAERHELLLVHAGPGRCIDAELARGCVEVISVDPPSRGPAMQRVHRAAALARGATVWSADPVTAALAEQAQVAVRRFRPDVVQVEYARLTPALDVVGRRPLRVATIHEPAASRQINSGIFGGRDALAARLDALASVREERRLLATTDAAVVFTEQDRAVVTGERGVHCEVAVIPLATTIPPRSLSPVGAEPPTIFFVGSFVHPPNVVAALRLGRSIFPPLIRTHPTARLEIVGEHPPAEVRALSSSSIRVVPGVADLTPLLDRAAVVAAPVETGGGARVKVLDALAAGKAVVTTTRGAAGISAPLGEVLLVADSDEDLSSAISRLLDNPDARADLGRRARAWAERELRWATMATRYDDLYERVRRRRLEARA